MNLSIVIPLYNEDKSIEELNSSIVNVINNMDLIYEIIYIVMVVMTAHGV